MRLLVVEDSARLRDSLADGLTAAGFAVDTAPNGRDGLLSARATSYDAIVLDLMLPEVDGLTVLRTLRSEHRSTPILILSANDRIAHRVEGLSAGADDYLVKPFSFDELLARLRALIRRSRGLAARLLLIPPIELDLDAKSVLIGATTIDFPPREYALLEYLCLHAGRVVPRSELEEHIYASDKQVWSNAVDSAVAAIRRRLTPHASADFILTRRGIGYLIPKPEPKRSEGQPR